MQRSTAAERRKAAALVRATRRKIERLLRSGKKVHVIWDFDGVLIDSRSDDVFTITGSDLKAYFAHEERLVFESPKPGPWLLPIAHNHGPGSFPAESFTQDIVTARSSTLAIRVHVFCLAWNLQVRWALFLGHQPKKEAYRIILKSFANDPGYHVFCIDDSAKHIEAFRGASVEEGMEERAHGILAPVIRSYSQDELREYYARVMSAAGPTAIRVRDPSDDLNGFLVLPGGAEQFRKEFNALVGRNVTEGYGAELRDAFVRASGEVGQGRFKSEEELQQAMRDFIVGLHCP